MAGKRPRVDPTDDWQELLPLFWWPEQEEYERIRQPVLFACSVAERAFFSTRHTRTLDDLGYLVLERFRLYAEEGLARREVAVWAQEGSLTVEYGGEALSRYEVECDPASGASSVGKLRGVKSYTLFESSIVLGQLKLFDLGEEGWVKFLKLDEYAPRQPRCPDALQQVLIPYTEAGSSGHSHRDVPVSVATAMCLRLYGSVWSAALPKSFRHLFCFPHQSTIPNMNNPTRFRIRPLGKDYTECVRIITS